MTFQEDREDGNKLSLWPTTENKVWIEIGDWDIENPYGLQGIPLDIYDAKALRDELIRIVKFLEGCDPIVKTTTKKDEIKPQQLTLGEKPFKWVG